MSAALVPAGWMPNAKIKGIVVHWTAGPHKATSLDRKHYHIIIQGDGTLVRGDPTIDLNGLPIAKRGYAAHTRNCNSGWIGVSLACMAEAKESPFRAGSAPMTQVQWDKLPLVLADLCRRYGIAVTDRTVLSHAEVQTVLGIKQAGKWDISAIPAPAGGMRKVRAFEAGDLFRNATAARLKDRDPATVIDPFRATATAADLRSSAPIIPEVEQSQKVAAAGTVIAGSAGAVGFLGEMSGYASTLRVIVGDVPPWVWSLSLLGLAGTMGFLWWRARRIRDRRVAMHNMGEVA